MIAHPFEIKPSRSTESPDELMITWGGTPRTSVADVYLPAVPAADIIALADAMYVKHRLSATEMHTVRCSPGDVTFLPIPPGQGRYAGLLSLETQLAGRPGDTYTIAVRQFTQVSATVNRAPERPASRGTRKTRAKAVAPPRTFSWRQAQGAFQYTMTVTPADDLRYQQERLLAWLKWRIRVVSPSSRWLPVLQRYLAVTASLVASLGGNPDTIPPSQFGTVPGKHPGRPPRRHRVGESPECIGKVVAVDYDRFGDFSGFMLLTEAGHEHYFRSRERAIETLVRDAWVDRAVVGVRVEEHDRDVPVGLVLHRHH